MSDKIKVVSAPVRIDISGGWPDSDPYRREFGGVVLNAAVNLRVSYSFERHSLGDVPPSSGLGASGAIRAAEVVASNNDLLKDRRDLIKRVHMFENQVLGQRAGFQDEAAAIYGGVNLWEFGHGGSYSEVGIRRTEIPLERARHLHGRLVLVYTGQSHLSPDIHDLVFGAGNYEKNIPKLDRMKVIARAMPDNITNEERMAALIKETWELQRSLHDSIETETMREIQEKARDHYLACRATGAGGGGCMIFYTTRRSSLQNIIRELEEEIEGVKLIPFNFDYDGLRIED